MLSILIPVYNYEISPLVIEIYNQLQKVNIEYEIIVIDDYSTQTSIASLNKEISVPGYTYITQKENLGRVATRMRLAQLAKYEWLLFLDADVIPKNPDFIERIYTNISNEIDMIFGGISYQSKIPEEGILRWMYGQKKEVKNVTLRNTQKYLSIISQNFVIRKSLCLEVMPEMDLKKYGLDILFSYELEKRRINIKHIDNPTIHLGLEDNNSFIKKSLGALETTLYLEKKSKIPDDYRPVQKAYKLLRNIGCSSLFYFLVKSFKKLILKNLRSNKPSITLFDFYRLYHYIKIQRECN